MSKKNTQPAVKRIGHILYSEVYADYWFNEKPGNKDKRRPDPTYNRVCLCKGYSADLPFSVFHHDVEGDEKPFKVVYEWKNKNYTTFTFEYQGSIRTEIDNDTYYMLGIVEEHATKTAAQAAMRKLAAAARSKIDAVTPSAPSDLCNCTYGAKGELRIGDLIEYTSCPGIVWKIAGERKTSHGWALQLEPVFSFLVRTNTDKAKEISWRDVYNYVRPIDLKELRRKHAELASIIV